VFETVQKSNEKIDTERVMQMKLTYEQRVSHSRRMAKMWSERPLSILDYKHGNRAGDVSTFQRLHIRNLYGRNCVLCGKSEVFNYQKLSLHHIENQYSHGDGQPWTLSLLCNSCHNEVHEPSLDSHLKTLLLFKAFELAYEEKPWIRRGDCLHISVDNIQFESEPLLV